MEIYLDIKKQLDEFNLSIKFQDSGTIGLLGSSGCGKSMTLKCIAGIVEPDSGIIIIKDKVVFDSARGINLPPQERGIGFVFQNYALFPHMTVEKNLGFSLKKKFSKNVIEKKVLAMAENMEILELLNRYPNQLSGGQQQRVSLGRALITDPKILLLDEPFSALDSYLKMNLQEWLEIRIKNFHGPVVFVSHNIEEVSRICDNIIVLDKGNVIESGDAKKVLHNPKSIKAAILSGCKNISPISNIDGNRVKAVDWDLTFELDNPIPKDANYIGFRGIDVVLSEDSVNSMNCKIAHTWDGVNLVGLDLIPPGGKGHINMEISRKEFEKLTLSDHIQVQIKAKDIMILK